MRLIFLSPLLFINGFCYYFQFLLRSQSSRLFHQLNLTEEVILRKDTCISHDNEVILFGMFVYIWITFYVGKQLYLLYYYYYYYYYYYSLIVSWILLIVNYIYDRLMDIIIVYMMNGWNEQELEGI